MHLYDLVTQHTDWPRIARAGLLANELVFVVFVKVLGTFNSLRTQPTGSPKRSTPETCLQSKAGPPCPRIRGVRAFQGPAAPQRLT